MILYINDLKYTQKIFGQLYHTTMSANNYFSFFYRKRSLDHIASIANKYFYTYATFYKISIKITF